MKHPRPDDDARDAQAGSPVALVLIDLLADPTSALYSSLRVCDLFCVRLTCKEAWRRIHHNVLTKSNVWKTAMNGMDEPHVPLLRWCMRQEIPLIYCNGQDIGATGNIPLIEEYVARYGRHELLSLFLGAARAGVATAALSLHSRLDVGALDKLGSVEVGRHISAGGLVEVAQVLNMTSRDWHYFTLAPALQKGHRPFVQWVLTETTLDAVHRDYAVVRAAESGSLDLIRWLVEEKMFRVTDETAPRAASAGALDVLQWLHARYGCDLQSALDGATCNGQLHVLEWLIKQGCALTEQTLYEAAQKSTTATVAWLLGRGCPCDEMRLVESSCRNIRTGDVFKFLVETMHMEFIPHMCRAAVVSGSPCVEAALHGVLGGRLSENFLRSSVVAEDIGSLRYGLKHGASLRSSALRAMLYYNQWAMLYETIEHSLVDGQLTVGVRALIDEAVSSCGMVSDESVEILARFGYHVPEDQPSSIFLWVTSLLQSWWRPQDAH